MGHRTSGGSTTPFKLCKSPTQCLLLLPALGVIAYDGSDARGVTVRGVEQGYSEGDRETLAIFAQGRDPQDVSIVARLTCPHNGVISIPVPLPEALWDNEVERVAYCFGGREAKETLGSRVPQHNQAFDISNNDRIPSCMDQGMQIHMGFHADSLLTGAG